MVKPFTTESAAKAREASDAQREIYTRKFMEDDQWVELAKRAGIHLPMFYARPSDSAIKGVLRKLNVPWELYLEAYGWKNADHFETLNPRYSMRPLTGLILELWDEQNRLKESCEGAADARGVKLGDEKPKKMKFPRGVPKGKRPPIPLD
jgi:hypothetical protein